VVQRAHRESGGIGQFADPPLGRILGHRSTMTPDATSGSSRVPFRYAGTMPSRTLPDTLPAKVYLLACDVERHRLRGSNVALVVRGALLAELSLRGCVTEEDGAVRASGTRRTGDPVLDEALRTMGDDRARSWRSWLRRGARPTLAAVRRQLESVDLIRTEPQRILGIFSRTRITVTDPAQVTALRASVRDAVLGDGPTSRVSTVDATLIALVAVGELGGVLSRQERRRHSERIAEFTERGGDAIPALKRVLRQIRAARAAASGG
jgi:hypothetical protein